MRAQIKTLLPASVMVKISLTDSSQITPVIGCTVSSWLRAQNMAQMQTFQEMTTQFPPLLTP